jgi:DNA-binding transcriptional LysR family regulator
MAFHQALDEEFVGLNSANALQNYLGQQAARAGRTLKLRVQLSGFDAICRMVEHGVGIAVIPETATRYRRRQAIAVVRLTDAWSVRKLMLCVRHFDDLSDHAKQLIEHLIAGGCADRE